MDLENKSLIAEKPEDLLFQYQLDIVQDASRFKIISCSRQCGKSTIFAYESVADCMAYATSQWIAVSAGQRQASEWLAKARKWAKIFELYLGRQGVHVKVARATQTELEFSNGSKITALPPNPSTIRGYTANVILDEFAHFDQPDKIWGSVVPSITSGIGGRELKVRIASTVFGKSNLFWKFLNDGVGSEAWSAHIVTVEDAVRDGFPIDIAAIKSGISDPDIWAQEYMCQPVDSSTALFTYDVIEACESDEASTSFDESEMDTPGKRYVIGMDIGRQRNFTVLWTALIGVNNKLITREVRVLEQTSFQEQKDVLFSKLRRRGLEHACIDATGMGYNLAEEAEREFGSGKVTKFMFTEQSKSTLFVNAQTALQARTIAIPKDDKIREDLHAMQRLFTSSGRVLYRAPNNKDGHSDRAVALALAIAAAKKATEPNNGAESLPAYSFCDENGWSIGRKYSPYCY